jgi:phosphonate transport system substrate-binding protein
MFARSGGTIGWVALLLAAAGCSESRYKVVRLDETRGEQVSAAVAPPSEPTLRFSIAGVEAPRDTYGLYTRLVERLGARLGRKVELVQRRTYKEVNELLADGELDAALLCAGGYLDLRRRSPGAVEVVAVPLMGGKTSHRTLVIVADGSGIASFDDLAGKRFAFTDELSFSGRTYPAWLLKQRGLSPEQFFGSTIFTRSHDRSITGVATGLVDGAAVHGGVLEHVLLEDPALARRIRVVHESPPLFSMPVVVSTKLPRDVQLRLREVLLELHQDPEAVSPMRIIGIDAFVAPPARLFEGAESIVQAMQ